MELTESVRFVATPHDRDLLEKMARLDGQTSMSAFMRRLIRQEAQRRGFQTLPPDEPVELVESNEN